MWSRRSFFKVGVFGTAGALCVNAGSAERFVTAQDTLLGRGPSGDLTKLSLGEAADLLRRKKISPVDLTSACLQRIQRLNPILNAFITVTPEIAMAQAREAEAEIQRGKWRGPLHGIPIGLKDLIDTAGVRTTCGSAVFADRVPTEDAEVVRRLKLAGAVLVGKQNMQEFASGATSVPSHYGAVHNPWDTSRIAGGSSGGSAAAVAAGLCFGALGSDTGGSVRQPSAYCGITGLKPTYGRVSTRGVVPYSWSLDHVGPMCRTVLDTALLLEGIAGYDPFESTSVDWPTERYSNALGGKRPALKVGLVRRPFFEQLDSEIDEAVNLAASIMGKLAVESRDVELPPARPPNIVGSIGGAEAYTFHAQYFTKTPDLYHPWTQERLKQGASVRIAAYVEARRELDRLRRSVASVFSAVDLLVTPTTPIQALTIEAVTRIVPSPEGELSVRNTRPFSMFGLPTISIPCGFTRGGLPIGLQIAGPRFGEAKIFALAHAFEQTTDWHRRVPAL